MNTPALKKAQAVPVGLCVQSLVTGDSKPSSATAPATVTGAASVPVSVSITEPPLKFTVPPKVTGASIYILWPLVVTVPVKSIGAVVGPMVQSLVRLMLPSKVTLPVFSYTIELGDNSTAPASSIAPLPARVRVPVPLIVPP